MSIEHKLQKELEDYNARIQPPDNFQRIEQTYLDYISKKERKPMLMKKWIISGITAAAVLGGTYFSAGPQMMDAARSLLNLPGTEEVTSFTTKDDTSDYVTTNLQVTEVQANDKIQRAMQDLYKLYPEAKKFEVLLAQQAEGQLDNKPLHQYTFILSDTETASSDHPKEVTLMLDSKDGQLQYIQADNLDTGNEQLLANDKQATARIDQLLTTAGIDPTPYMVQIHPKAQDRKDGITLEYTGNSMPSISVDVLSYQTVIRFKK